MAQYVDLKASGTALVEVDMDPDFLSTLTQAYIFARVMFNSSALPDMLVNFTSSLPGILSSDDWGISLHRVGSDFYFWASPDPDFYGPIPFDVWIELEAHLVVGNSYADMKIDGVDYPGIGTFFSPIANINYFLMSGMPNAIVGDGGGTAADDIISVDELSWAPGNFVSLLANPYARWAFDGADPLNDANTNWPDPPWSAFQVANMAMQTGGDANEDCSPGECGGDSEPDPPPDPVACCGDDLGARVFIGGTEVTSVSTAGSWTPRLNRPAQATVTIPMDSAIGDVGDLLRIEMGACIVFHGRILNREVDSSKDEGRVVYNAQDAMEILQFRPVRDDDGDLSKPRIIEQYITGPQIIEAALINSVDSTGRVSLDALPGGPPPTQAEGPLPIIRGGFAGGGPNLTGAPVDWPMQISELISLLVSTGQVDVIASPINPGGGVTAQVDVYNGNYGTDRSGSVVFEYGTGARNAAQVRWNRDMTGVVNKYQLYGGPQVATAADPAGDQHWCFNVQGFDTGLAYPPGGRSVNPDNTEYFGGDPDNPLGHRIYASRIANDVRARIDIIDGYDDNCIPHFGTPGRDLYRRQWQVYSWLAAQARDIIHVTPVAGTELGCFHIGDLIGVTAVSDVLGGFSGAQRVMEYTISWEATPSVLTLSEIQTSTDAEGSGG